MKLKVDGKIMTAICSSLARLPTTFVKESIDPKLNPCKESMPRHHPLPFLPFFSVSCLLPCAPSIAQDLKTDWGRQCESYRAALHCNPDCERVAANLLRGEALGAGDLAWHSHWDHNGASVANGGDRDGCDGGPARCVAEIGSASITSHAVGEGGSHVVVLERDDRPLNPESVSKRLLQEDLQRLTIGSSPG